MVLSCLSATVFAEDYAVDSSEVNSVGITELEITQQLENTIPFMINSVMNNPSLLGFTQDELKNSYIGEAFSITNIENESNAITNNNDIKYLPIISDDNIIGIIKIIKNNNDISCTIGKDFSAKLNSFVNGFDNNIPLISNGKNIFAVCDNNVKIIQGCQSEIAKETNELLSNQLKISKKNLINTNELKQKNIDIDTLVKSQNKNSDLISSDIVTTSSSGNHSLPNYPLVAQGNLGICWAASIASILRYELPSTYGSITAMQVRNQMINEYPSDVEYDENGNYIEGRAPVQARKYLDYYLPSSYSPTYYVNALNMYEVKTIIDGDDPIYLSCGTYTVSGERIGHAVTLYGYADVPGYHAILIMNSGQPEFATAGYNSGKFQFSYNNKIFTWEKTVTIDN